MGRNIYVFWVAVGFPATEQQLNTDLAFFECLSLRTQAHDLLPVDALVEQAADVLVGHGAANVARVLPPLEAEAMSQRDEKDEDELDGALHDDSVWRQMSYCGARACSVMMSK